jgi:hypothetical protein
MCSHIIKLVADYKINITNFPTLHFVALFWNFEVKDVKATNCEVFHRPACICDAHFKTLHLKNTYTAQNTRVELFTVYVIIIWNISQCMEYHWTTTIRKLCLVFQAVSRANTVNMSVSPWLTACTQIVPVRETRLWFILTMLRNTERRFKHFCSEEPLEGCVYFVRNFSLYEPK